MTDLNASRRPSSVDHYVEAGGNAAEMDATQALAERVLIGW